MHIVARGRGTVEKFLEVCGGDGRRKMAAGAIEVFDLAAQIFLPNMNCVMGTLAGNRLRKCECFLQEREREIQRDLGEDALGGEKQSTTEVGDDQWDNKQSTQCLKRFVK